MITVWNHSNREVVEGINGTMIAVPANGSALVTDKKAAELMKRRKEISAQPTAGYTAADFEAMRKLSLEQLQALAEMLMRGAQPGMPAPGAGAGTEPKKK